MAAFGAFFVLEGLGIHRLLTTGLRRPALLAVVALILILSVRATLKLDYAIAALPGAGRGRAALATSLAAKGPEHIVFVEYAADHDLEDEWIYNAADPDRSAVIWARDMGAANDAVLRRGYPGRKAWLATVSGASVRRLVPLGD